MRHALALVVACVGVWPAGVEAGGHRDLAVAGTLETQVVECASLCTESEWAGPLDGTSSFTLISLEDLGIPNTNISRFHGDLVLSTPRGDLIGQDTGLWNLDTGAYVDVYTVTSGTGDYAGARGVIILTGTLDPVTGEGHSRYRGSVTMRRHR
ncbi:MAG: hypothetical protein H7138_16220 [Myxococcales bacterium]|nr:hypothetical protein [Myxococcales bacterium]